MTQTKRKKVTLKDISRSCGVSTYTISSVLNDKGDISQDTRDRVLKAVKKMNYTPTVRTRPAVKTRTIGLVLPGHTGDADGTFNYRAISAAARAAREQIYDCKVLTLAELRTRIMEKLFTGTAELGCDQLVFFCPIGTWQDLVPPLREKDIPVAVVRRQAGIPGVICVQDDDYAGMRTALCHLADRGHRHIALIRPATETDDQLGRMRAYRDVLAERGLPADDRLVLTRPNGGFDLAGDLADLRSRGLDVTAVAAYSDDRAAWAARHLLAAGFRIPDDVAVMGYNNDAVSRTFYPSISTVDVPVEKMVAAAVNAVVAYRPEMADMRQVLSFGNELIARDSTDKTIPADTPPNVHQGG